MDEELGAAARCCTERVVQAEPTYSEQRVAALRLALETLMSERDKLLRHSRETEAQIAGINIGIESVRKAYLAEGENIPDMLPDDWGAGYPNVWLGTTVESPKEIRRVWDVLQVPAAIHFLSCEPLLGDVTERMGDVWKYGDAPHLDWIICGGESAKGVHRPMGLQWARNLRDYCQDSGIAFFMKQIDKKQPIPDDLMIREFPRLSGLASGWVSRSALE